MRSARCSPPSSWECRGAARRGRSHGGTADNLASQPGPARRDRGRLARKREATHIPTCAERLTWRCLTETEQSTRPASSSRVSARPSSDHPLNWAWTASMIGLSRRSRPPRRGRGGNALRTAAYRLLGRWTCCIFSTVRRVVSVCADARGLPRPLGRRRAPFRRRPRDERAPRRAPLTSCAPAAPGLRCSSTATPPGDPARARELIAAGRAEAETARHGARDRALPAAAGTARCVGAGNVKSTGDRGRSADLAELPVAPGGASQMSPHGIRRDVSISFIRTVTMPRGPRLDAPGALHHVIARGIDRSTIFRDDGDRTRRTGGRLKLLGCRRLVHVFTDRRAADALKPRDSGGTNPSPTAPAGVPARSAR